MYGHSSGGALSLRAAEAGLAIPKLAVYEPPFIVDGGRDPLTADYFPHIEELSLPVVATTPLSTS